MLRGMTTFICKECGHKFVAPDCESNATVETMPWPCPKCGSHNTTTGVFSSLFRLLRHKK